MRILITGGCGFLGSALVKEALNKGFDVTVLDDLSIGKPENIPISEVRFLIGDIRDENMVKRAMEDVDAVFHMAARCSSAMIDEDPREALSVNINGFLNILYYASIKKAKRLIYPSSSSIYGNMFTPHKEDMLITTCLHHYASSKICNEYLAKTFTQRKDLDTVSLRIFSGYGPGEKHKGESYATPISVFLWKLLKNEQPIIYGEGNQGKDFIYVDDIVKACFLALEKPNIEGEIFNVGTGKETSFNEIIAILNEILGKNIQPKYVSNPIQYYQYHTQADTTKAEKILGFKAEIPLRKGIEMLIGEK